MDKKIQKLIIGYVSKANGMGDEVKKKEYVEKLAVICIFMQN